MFSVLNVFFLARINLMKYHASYIYYLCKLARLQASNLKLWQGYREGFVPKRGVGLPT
jgi:hypothetical protein